MASSSSASTPIAHFDQVNICPVGDEGLQQTPLAGGRAGLPQGSGPLTGVRVEIVGNKHDAVLKVSKGEILSVINYGDFLTVL